MASLAHTLIHLPSRLKSKCPLSHCSLGLCWFETGSFCVIWTSILNVINFIMNKLLLAYIARCVTYSPLCCLKHCCQPRCCCDRWAHHKIHFWVGICPCGLSRSSSGWLGWGRSLPQLRMEAVWGQPGTCCSCHPSVNETSISGAFNLATFWSIKFTMLFLRIVAI